MDISSVEISKVSDVQAEAQGNQVQELTQLQLASVGGGIGETVQRAAGSVKQGDFHPLPFGNLIEIMGDGVALVDVLEASGAYLEFVVLFFGSFTMAVDLSHAH